MSINLEKKVNQERRKRSGSCLLRDATLSMSRGWKEMAHLQCLVCNGEMSVEDFVRRALVIDKQMDIAKQRIESVVRTHTQEK